MEALAARWVVENQWPSELASRCGFTVLHYEHLRSRPDTAWRQILHALGLERAPGHALLEQPSQQSSKDEAGAERPSRRTRWQRAFTAEQMTAVQRILDETECGMYSMTNPEPSAFTDCVPLGLNGVPGT